MILSHRGEANKKQLDTKADVLWLFPPLSFYSLFSDGLSLCCYENPLCEGP